MRSGQIVSITSIPSSNGQTESEVDLENWTVTVRAGLFNDSIDASVSGEEPRGRKLNTREAKKLADDIQLILDNNPDCLSYINGILDKAQSDANPQVSRNPLDVFWAIYQQNGFYDVPNLDAGGYAIGAVANGTAKVELKSRNYDISAVSSVPVSKKGAENYRRTQELLQASTALNEVVHLTGAFTYGDRAMSIATADYLGIPQPKFPYKTRADVSSWSNWWHPKVQDRCSVQRVINNENKRRR